LFRPSQYLSNGKVTDIQHNSDLPLTYPKVNRKDAAAQLVGKLFCDSSM